MPSNQELADRVKKLNEEKAELEAKLENTPAVTDTELANEVEDLKVKLKLSKEMEASLTDKIEGMSVPEIVDGQTANGILVMTAERYGEYSKENGRVMGRKAGQKTVCSIEELRSLINSNWSPSMVMEKHGIDEKELQQLIWKLSLAELRDTPIRYDVKRDFFGREG